MPRLSAIVARAAVVTAAALAPGVSLAQDFTFSVEYPATLGGNLFNPNQTVRHASAAPFYTLAFDGGAAGLDAETVIDALVLLPGGDFLFSTQAPFTAGASTYMPADVVRYVAASGTFALHLAGASLGLSSEADIDALALDASGRVVLSLAYPETVGLTTFEPGDLAVVDGGTMQMFVSAASLGLPSDVNVIGYERPPDGSDLLQFDIPQSLGTSSFVAGDVARHQGGVWSVYFHDPAFPEDGTGRDLSLPCLGVAFGGSLDAAKSPGGTEITWTSGNAALFDLVRGSLSRLRASAGDFTQALDAIVPGTDVCMLNDGTANAIVDPRPDPGRGDGYFYLVRAVAGCGAGGTYDTGVPTQIGSRDAEIAAALDDCP